MKKLIFGIFLFLAFTISASATSFYIVDEIGNKTLYEEKKIANSYAFLIGSDLNNKKRLNNLAYVARYRNDIKYHATIQLLILKESNPNKDYYLSDGINKINISELSSLIETYISEYAKLPTFGNSTYEISYEEPYTIYTSESLSFYKVNNSSDVSVEVYGNAVSFTPHKSGNIEVSFLQNELSILNNYIYAPAPAYDEFTIHLNIPHNKIKLNIEVPENTDYNLLYGIYDEDDNLLEKFAIDKNSNIITFPRGINISLKEITPNSIYVLDEDKYFSDSPNTNEVTIKKEYKYFSQTINTYDFNSLTKEKNLVSSSITIYDSQNNYYKNCTSSSSCSISIPYGTYTFIDNLTNYKVTATISSDGTIDLYRYKINALNTEENISKISIGDKMVSFHKDGSLIIFDEAIAPGEYTFNVGSNTYLVDLRDNSNYEFNESYGLIYNLDRLTSSSSKEPFKDISISIPNTGLSLNIKGEILFEKKNKIYLTPNCSYYSN